MKAPRNTAVQYPTIVYQAWEKPLRHFDCVTYNDCLNFVSKDAKAMGFGCQGCPWYRKSADDEPEPSTSPHTLSEHLIIGSMIVAMIYFGLRIIWHTMTGDSL